MIVYKTFINYNTENKKMSLEYMNDLNSEQKLAVTTVDGPLLVLSGAGTGKTRVLTSRIAHILYNGFARPWEILALTFTNKAANEMRFRVAQYNEISHLCGDLWMGTFHSVCLRILRSNWAAAGLRRDFLIYGEDDQKSVLKRVITDLGLDTKEFNPSDWVDKISNLKDKGIFDVEKMGLSNISQKIVKAYNAELLNLGAVDFGDIILFVLKLFENNQEILHKYQNQFKYILVDEFQDTNAAQMALLKMLTKDKEQPNICCVGDDDQSIYSWRGAEIRNILEFEKTYIGAKIIRLETNYRSSANILGAANSLIKNNMGRLGKDLRPVNIADTGEPVYVLTVPSDWDEARFVADTISRNANNNFSNFAVLIRAGSISRTFEEEFTSRGVPYKLVGAQKFYDRAEIRDAIAYIRLLVYPFDNISFERIISKPRRGFGDSAIAKLRESGKSFMDALKTTKLSAKQNVAANEFLSVFDFDWQNTTPKDAVQQLLERSGYLKMWRESKDTDAPERLEHIRELINGVVSKYDTLPAFLEHAALMMTDDNDNETGDKNVVSIMTIHAAKGLEFNTVFLPAWEEGVFPNEKKSDNDMEEERRLAYVAITRARVRVIITNAMVRTVFGQRMYQMPSRFIGEIDKQFINDNMRPRQNENIKTYTKPTVKKIESSVGKMVQHNEMGSGVVIAENGNILTVAFKTRGIKNVERSFVKFI
ncbi:MAG: UvrD-helicase domain-containing protein [Alphaproteobacteria bacterium]|nr:UvrD-helicase domain-containing protein [Alphaproteobacteria bacterium]